MQQQGNKNFQNGRPQNLLCSNLTKGPSPSKDEFKYGFPSEGLLSVASDKWWGSRSPDANDGEEIQEGKQHRRDMVDNDTRVPLVDTEGPESGTIDNPVNLQATASLSVLRKRAAKEGREALMLGISRSHGVKKLGRREKALLLRIFKSSLPDRWMREFH